VGEQISDRHNPSRQLKVNEDGSIDVNTTGIDVQIGAVELKNGTTDQRAVVDTDGSLQTTLYSEGAAIGSSLDSDGNNYLSVALIQDVNVAAGNSSSTNLASGATWTGDPVSTLGVVGLQWNLNTDQNCTIYSEESAGSHTGLGTLETAGTTTLLGTDTVFERSFVVGDTISVEGETDRIVATIVSDTELTVTVAFTTTDTGLTYTHYHWDISYPFEFIYKEGQKGEGETVQATNAYWRLRVVNEGPSTTTFFRVSGVLCPIATPLPSSLSADRRLKVETTISGRENTSRHVWVSPTNTLSVNDQVRLVGTNFDGTVKDTNFWTETVTNDGTVVQTGEIKLQTNTTANGTAKYVSARRARFVVGSALLFQGIYKFNDTVTEADNLRRFGAYDGVTGVSGNGYYFELDSGVFSVGTRKDGTESRVSSGNFNGNYGPTWTPLSTTYYKFSIEYTPSGAFYYVNGKLLHKSIGGHLTRFLTLPITMENINDNDNATAVVMDCLGVVISRQGQLMTNPSSYYHAYGATAGVNLKIGAGTIHSIIFGGAANNAVVTLSDSTSAATPALWVYTATGALDQPISVDMGGLPFNNGLRLTVTNSASCTIVYE